MKTLLHRAVLSGALSVFAVSLPLAAETAVSPIPIAKPSSDSRFSPLFPHALTQSGAVAFASTDGNAQISVAGMPGEAGEQSATAVQAEATRLQSVLLNNDVFALYGKPGSRAMGILGQYSLAEIGTVMDEFVTSYDAANGERGIIPAFYIIYGTCWPEGNIGRLSADVVRSYIEYAAERGWYVFLDHQIGKYSVESSVKELLPWLQYPNVQLALDPEWRTTKPMQEIGSVTAEEINRAQSMIQDYLVEHSLPGRRMLVVHQFKPRMILNRPDVKSDFDLVQLIHCADGFGSPQLKKSTYALNAEATNIPLKSFKLFLKPAVDGAGYDQPLMSPDEVLQLNPRPYLIMYQ